MTKGDLETIITADRRVEQGYPEGASPGECIAVDVDRFIAEGRFATTTGFDAIAAAEFDRACRARGATEIVHLKRSWSCRGTTVIAVANADLWCCVLVRIGVQDVGVMVPAAGVR